MVLDVLLIMGFTIIFRIEYIIYNGVKSPTKPS